MGRPPCCDKVGIKKGPWTPEEDIILVSYIREHGPGNWRSVPTNTGLLRCSKSCRLRWTNYLRPGIKRGNFTSHEEGMIIHLQALLGNKWAAIASYLPQRTDNDIKNYWNTHLKKKLKNYSKSFVDPRKNLGFNAHPNVVSSTLTPTTTYASSTENISRLLEGWMRTSPKPTQEKPLPNPKSSFCDNITNDSSLRCFRSPKPEYADGSGGGCSQIGHEEFEAILSFDDNLNCIGSWGKADEKGDGLPGERKPRLPEDHDAPPLTFLEKWLLDETGVTQVEELMDMF